MITVNWNLLLLVFLISLNTVTCALAATGFDPSGGDNCRRTSKSGNKSTCYELNHNLCFGTQLPYKYSTSELVDSNLTQYEIQNDLSRWEGLRRSPKCWAVLQPLLCAVYMPKCQDDVIELPSQELCKVTRSLCRLVVEQVMKEWPEFFKCDDTTRYSPNCKNTQIRELQFNTTAECMDPMIPVNDSSSYYEGFEGCGLKCQDPLFSNEEHTSMSKRIFCGSILLFVATLFVMGTYWLNWKSSRGQPSEIIFYVVLSFAVANLGWLLQFWPNAKSDIVCRPDGTIQRNEVDQNVFCLIEFSLVYFGSLAALGWLAVFAFVWNLSCNAAGTIRQRVENQAAYFHCLIWILSAFLTILSISLGKIEGNSMSGVCFVGYTNPVARIGLVLVPLSTAFLVMLFYMGKSLHRLSVVRRSSDLIPPCGRKHLTAFFRRALFFTTVAGIIILTFLVTDVYQMALRPSWIHSLRQSLICRIKLKDMDMDDCSMSSQPSVDITGLNIFLFFAGGFLVCTWACTRETIDTWQRQLPRYFSCCSKKKPQDYRHNPRARKDRLIAHAYEKKKRLGIGENGSISLTIQSIHGDPIGLNRILDPNQLCQERNQTKANEGGDDGEEVSSEWLAALPHLLERRNALTIQYSGSEDGGSRPPSEMGRRHSQDSNSDLDKPKKRSRLSKLKEKLGSRGGIGRRGRRGSISSFESSELGSKQYQSSNSELDKTIPKSKSGLSKLKDKMGRRNGIGWRARFGSISSLESNATGIVLPSAISGKKGGGNKGVLELHHYRKHTLLVKEFSMQTSFENLPLLNTTNAVVVPVQKMDKSMQTSLQSLHQKDFGTQTRKSATKKKKRRTAEENPDDGDIDGGGGGEGVERGGGHDPVLQLLTPG